MSSIVGTSQQPHSYAANNPTNYTDPSGQIPIAAMAAGALVGGGIELGSQVLGNWLEGCGLFHDINWEAVAKEAAVGAAISGATAGFGNWALGSRVAPTAGFGNWALGSRVAPTAGFGNWALGSRVAPRALPTSSLPSRADAANLIRSATPTGRALTMM